MKQSKKIAQLKQTAIEITNKQQLHQIKGGEIIGAEDIRTGLIGAEDVRTGVIGTDDYRH